MYFQTYLETWQDLSALSTLPITKNTNIALAFASFNFDEVGTIGGIQYTKDQIKQVIDTVHDKGGKVSLSFGGQKSLYYLSHSNLWPNVDAISQHIFKIIDIYGFDGIDLDIEEPNVDAKTALSLLKALDALNAFTIITLTVPAQGWGTPYEDLCKAAHLYVKAINFMEYDIWLGAQGYVEQIKEDILTYYVGQWGIPAGKICLGLMPGHDDKGEELTLDMADQLSIWAKQQGLSGVLTWDANIDYKGIVGNPSYAFANKIMGNIS